MGKRKVLVVDDIFANQFLLASMLEEMECNIRTASNGKEVFDVLADEMVDIIFMDIEMPVMNGIEATKKLKSDPKYSGIPVVALTAHNLEEFSDMFNETGFDGLLEKPYSIEGISEILDKF